MNTLTKLGLGMFALFVAFAMISQCGRKSTPPPPTAEKQAEVILKEYSKGLDLDAVTALAKKAKDAADFESLLNSQADMCLYLALVCVIHIVTLTYLP
jgi:hypothetical protein